MYIGMVKHVVQGIYTMDKFAKCAEPSKITQHYDRIRHINEQDHRRNKRGITSDAEQHDQQMPDLKSRQGRTKKWMTWI